MFGKRKNEDVMYDKTVWRPVLKCSICNGEQVAGFKNKNTGVFMEDCLIRNDGDLRKFRKKYGIKEEIEKIY